MSWSLLSVFFRKELRDIRANRRVWPGYLILPGIGIILPIILILVLPMIADPRLASDPGLRLLIETVQRDPTIAGTTLVERITRLLLRDLGMWYLLMPVALATGPAAVAIVREKEQRTLEPILATPLSDAGLVLSKLFGTVGPAMLWTWVSAVAGYGVTAIVTALQLGVAIGPTLGNFVGILFLAPVMAGAAALAAIAASARFTDSQSANIFTGLIIVPLTLIVLAVVGRPAMASAVIGLIATALGVLLALGLYRKALRRLRREELLTSWR
jgi:ABC-type Na+ efflux pump permease subunit